MHIVKPANHILKATAKDANWVMILEKEISTEQNVKLSYAVLRKENLKLVLIVLILLLVK